MEIKKIPSKYQVVIHEEYIGSNCNLIIKAGPGSGKSHTIQELLKITPRFKKCILISFNKSIKEELEKKVPVGVTVKTIHGLAFSILNSVTHKTYKVNGFKNFILGKKHLNLDKLPFKQRDAYLFLISKIIDLSRMNLAETKEDIEMVCDQYGISTLNGEIKDTLSLIKYLDQYNENAGQNMMVDFTDMLYLTNKTIKKELFPKYDVVFCDELQDLNPLQKEIVEKIIHPTKGRFIGVGDEKQAIYSFLGANSQAFESFVQRPNTKVLPLSVTYRCGKKIVDAANQIFPGLEPFEANIEGVVRKGNLDEVEDGDFVICRNNLPLIESWINIVKQGKKASILGKEFGQGLVAVINKLSNYPNYEDGVNRLLKDKEDQLKEKGITNPKVTTSYQTLVEKLNIVDILKKEFGSFELMKTKVEQIFTDNDHTNGVLLMTGHKSKGLETDRVFFLYPSLIPSKYAESFRELQQEQCLRFVITTRAKRELIYID